MNSNQWKNLYIVFCIIYVISHILPVCSFSQGGLGGMLYGFMAAVLGYLFYGLPAPAHISAIVGFFHFLVMQHPENPNKNWTIASIALAIVGTLPWFFIFFNEGLQVGYYLWTITTIGMAVSYYYFRIEKSKETTIVHNLEDELQEF